MSIYLKYEEMMNGKIKSGFLEEVAKNLPSQILVEVSVLDARDCGITALAYFEYNFSKTYIWDGDEEKWCHSYEEHENCEHPDTSILQINLMKFHQNLNL